MLRTLTTLLFIVATPLMAQNCADLSWEADLTYRFNNSHGPVLRGLSVGASDALIPIAVGVPVGLYVFGLINDRVLKWNGDYNSRYFSETGLQTAVSMGATYGMVILLKNVFDRDRPYQQHPGCIANYDNDTDGSMPSGHAAGSAALATALSLRFPHWYVIVPSVTYALLTGYSRLNLGMHYLSDVLVGYVIGSAVALGVHAVNSALFDLADTFLPKSSEPHALYGFAANQTTTVFSIAVPF